MKRVGILLASSLWFAACGFAHSQESRLGRLFFTPEERQKLDQKRGVVSSTVSGPQAVIVNGIVVRSGTAPILFLDGKEVRPGEAPAGLVLRSRTNQSVQLQTEGGQPVAAKPGQVVDLANGQSIDNYQLLPPPPASPPGAPMAVESDKGGGASPASANTRRPGAPEAGSGDPKAGPGGPSGR